MITLLLFGIALSGSSARENKDESSARDNKDGKHRTKNILILFTDEDGPLAEVQHKLVAEKYLKHGFEVYQFRDNHFVTYKQQKRVQPDWTANKIIVSLEGHGHPKLFSSHASARITRENFNAFVQEWRKSSNKLGIFMGFCFSGNWVPDLFEADLIVTGSCNKRKSLSADYGFSKDEEVSQYFRKSNPTNTMLGNYVFFYDMKDDRDAYNKNKAEEDDLYETCRSGPNCRRPVKLFWDAADFGSDFPGWMRIRNDCTRHKCSATHVWKGSEEKLSDWFMEPQAFSIISESENRVDIRWNDEHRAELLIENSSHQFEPFLNEEQRQEWVRLIPDIIGPKLGFTNQVLLIIGQNGENAEICFQMKRTQERDEEVEEFTCKDTKFTKWIFATGWFASE